MSVAATISCRCASTISTPTALSACATDHAKPDDVDASALKPSPCSQRADPTPHGFGMTKQPDVCSSRNARRLSAMDGRGMGSPWASPEDGASAAAATAHFIDRSNQSPIGLASPRPVLLPLSEILAHKLEGRSDGFAERSYASPKVLRNDPPMVRKAEMDRGEIAAHVAQHASIHQFACTLDFPEIKLAIVRREAAHQDRAAEIVPR